MPNNKINFAILTAVSEEMEFFKNFLKNNFIEEISIKNLNFPIYLYQNKRILLAETGLGTTFAASMLTLINEHFAPQFVLYYGTAGAIHAKLKIGDVVIAERAFEAELQNLLPMVKDTPFESCLQHPMKKAHFPSVYSADPYLLNIAKDIKNTHLATVVTSNAFPAPLELFEKIKSLDPYSIDMETSAIYQVAWLLDIPVLAVRGMSNILNHDGTDDNIAESDVHGSAKAAGEVVLAVMDRAIPISKDIGTDLGRDFIIR